MRQKKIAIQNSTKRVMLCLDACGDIASSLLPFFTKSFFSVYVGSREGLIRPDTGVHIQYSLTKRKIPKIPEYFYEYICVVYKGETEIKRNIGDFLDLASRTKSRLIFITDRNHYDEIFIKHILSEKTTTVFIVGNIFGDGVKTLDESGLGAFIQSAQKHNKILLNGDGLELMYPVDVADVSEKIFDTLIKGVLSSRAFFLFQKTPCTFLSVTRILQQIRPVLLVDYVHNTKQYVFPEINIPGTYLLQDSYPLKGKLQRVLESKNTQELIQARKSSLPIHAAYIRNMVLVLLSCLMFLIIPPIVTLGFLYGGARQMNNAIVFFEKKDYSSMYAHSKQAATFFSLAKKTVGPFALEAEIFNSSGAIQNIVHTIDIGGQASLSIVSLYEGVHRYISFFSGKIGSEKEFYDATGAIKETLLLFQKLKTEKTLPATFISQIDRFDKHVQILSQTIDLFPNLLGFNGKRTYAILFQNNMELRPTGGFIGSYGLVDVQKGNVTDFSIHDVYDADGNLKGHVDPPLPLQKYMGVTHWFLRDSNFDVDFLRAASSAAFFLKEETGVGVDGIITIDTTFLKKILTVIGPVMLVDYRETVTAENVYELTQKYVEKDFFAGSTQKKDFLRVLFAALQNKLLSKDAKAFVSLLGAIAESVEQKHILIALSNSLEQRPFTLANTSSSLSDLRKKEKNVIQDFFGINEANIGGNKVNYFIRRKISHEVEVSKLASVSGKATIYYRNVSQKGSSGGGEYKNYLRIILPLKSHITDISIDDIAQTLSFGEDKKSNKQVSKVKTLEIDSTQEEEKSIFGFLVTVGQDSLKKIIITYTLFETIDLSLPTFSYDLTVFKQPGTGEDPFSTSFSYIPGFTVIHKDTSFNQKGNKVFYSGFLTSDIKTRIDFAQE